MIPLDAAGFVVSPVASRVYLPTTFSASASAGVELRAKCTRDAPDRDPQVLDECETLPGV